MGENAQGDPIEDPMRALVEVFKIDTLSIEDRLRVLLVFILIRGNIIGFFFMKLVVFMLFINIFFLLVFRRFI